jgi:hypothetical protein
MKNVHFPVIILVCMMLFTGCATQSLHNTQFVMWEGKDNTHTFDKITAINARFLATTSNDSKLTVIHKGKEYAPTLIEMVNSHSNIGRYGVRIPGLFMPGNEVLQVKITNGDFTSMDETSVRIFPSHLLKVKSEVGEEISMEEEIAGLIKSLSKGDAVEFTAIPSSGLTIPHNQFRTYIEGTSNKAPAIGLSISAHDGYTVPVDAEKIGVHISWIDPNDQSNIVKIFPSDGSQAVETIPGLKRPRIVCGDISRIDDGEDPAFFVNCEIKPPIYPDNTLSVDNVKFDIMESNIKGYKVLPFGAPQFSAGKWSMGFKLVGKLPIPKGIGGSIKIRIKAAAKFSNGESSPEATKSCKFNVTY